MKKIMDNKMKTKDITQIAMTVSAMLVGGFMIYMISSRFPLPGLKYAAMAPYLSFVVALIIINFKLKCPIFIVNTVFAMVMAMISLYMAAAIFATGILTEMTQMIIPKHWRYRIIGVAAMYSVYTVSTALIISKLFIAKEVFERITGTYILVLMVLAFVLGVLGAYAGSVIGHRIYRSRQL